MQLALFMLVVSLIAGVVAAGGDWMGHRAARRKIRFGKMRPRHVSRLFAVITGVLISLVTFGVVFAVWKDVREAFTKYASVKKELAQAEASLDGMQNSLDRAERNVSEANEAVATANTKVTEAEEEVENLNVQLSDGRGEKFELAINLAGLNDQIAEKEKERDRLQNKIGKLNQDVAITEMRVEGLVGLKNQLGAEIEALEAQVASYQQGEIVIRRGTNLAYEQVNAGETGLLRDKLQSAINRVVVKLAKQGLDVDPGTEQRAEDFIQAYQQNGDSVVIISTAQNVIEDNSVLLDFDKKSLSPVVNQGGVVLEVKVKQSTASISAFGKPPNQVSVKSNLDAAGVDQLISAIETELQARAKDLGFLPRLGTGTISTKTAALSGMVETLVSQPKPFVIKFIADGKINILDGLDGVHIVVTDAS